MLARWLAAVVQGLAALPSAQLPSSPAPSLRAAPRNTPQVLALGYSERFWRKYRFYFAYCEAAFDAKWVPGRGLGL